MVEAKGRKEKYITELFNGTNKIYADVTKEKGGSGDYFRPHDLLLSAYTSCLNISIRMVMDSLNIEYEEVTVKADLDRSNVEKTVFKYVIDIVGQIDETTKKEIIEKAKSCPVRKTLSKQIEFMENCVE